MRQYLETAAKSLKAKTLEDHTKSAEAYILPDLRAVRLDRLTPGMIQSLYNKLQTVRQVSKVDGQGNVKKQERRALAPATVRRVHAVLHRALGAAVKWRMIPHNPASVVELPRLTKEPKMRTLTKEQARLFVVAIRSTPYGLLFELLLLTGCRPGEIYGLLWDSVDWENGALRIERGLSRKAGGGYRLEDPKTARARRNVALTASLMHRLKAHRARQAQDLEVPSSFVFCNGRGNPVDQRNVVQRHFKPALVRAGIEPAMRLYDLRHSAVSLLLASDESVKVVSERVGHASTAFTMDTYAHVLPGQQQRASDKLSEMIGLEYEDAGADEADSGERVANMPAKISQQSIEKSSVSKLSLGTILGTAWEPRELK